MQVEAPHQSIIDLVSKNQCGSLPMEQLPAMGQIQSCIQETGVVRIRGVDFSAESFSRYISSLGVRVLGDPARSQAGATFLIDNGRGEMDLHLENGTFSMIPDLCWMFCETAPAEGSQTTICDGQEVWNHLSQQARTFFLETKIRYERIFSEGQWKRLAAVYGFDSSTHSEGADFGDLYRWSILCDGQEFRKGQCNSVTSIYTTSAMKISRYSRQIAFANSLFSPSYNYTPPIVTTSDGRELPDHILEEVKTVTTLLTREINWRNNDILIIDNHRVMHGRRKILSPNRKIYNSLTISHNNFQP